MYNSTQASKYLLIGFLTIHSGVTFAQNIDASSLDDYQRAQYFINPNQSKVYEAYVSPNWVNEGDVFWYEKNGIDLKEYYLVDPKKKSRVSLFNRHVLAQKLQESSNDTINANDLPIRNLKYDDVTGSIEFRYGDNSYTYNIAKDILDKLHDPYEPLPSERLSPDGRFVAFVENYNLFIKEVATEAEIQLTHNGEMYFAYATTTESNLSYVTNIRRNWPVSPVLEWSNDSKKILTHQLDERKVASTHLLQMAEVDESLRPILYTYKYPVPTDSIIPYAYPSCN
jgi:dipeptidyl-peptidase 4